MQILDNSKPMPEFVEPKPIKLRAILYASGTYSRDIMGVAESSVAEVMRLSGDEFDLGDNGEDTCLIRVTTNNGVAFFYFGNWNSGTWEGYGV